MNGEMRERHFGAIRLATLWNGKSSTRHNVCGELRQIRVRVGDADRTGPNSNAYCKVLVTAGEVRLLPAEHRLRKSHCAYACIA